MSNNSKNYLVQTGFSAHRRYQRSRPTNVQKNLDATKKWCCQCWMSVSHNAWKEHCIGRKHRTNVRKEGALEDFAIELFERHRGKPYDEESATEKAILPAYEVFKESQRQREDAFSLRMANSPSIGTPSKAHEDPSLYSVHHSAYPHTRHVYDKNSADPLVLSDDNAKKMLMKPMRMSNFQTPSPPVYTDSAIHTPVVTGKDRSQRKDRQRPPSYSSP
eukprot:Tbor_TRINITY_DN386_c0_g1::TRINITY_DN386_c0_g1_i1::g.15467::m.15467